MNQEQLPLSVTDDRERAKNKPPRMPLGCVDFEELRKCKYYYIDKTGILVELLRDSATVALFTRPRRFGKTLTMFTLHDFLSIEKKDVAPSLFSGLQIMEDNEICNQWMNKYPVIFLSLKDIGGSDFQQAYRKLVDLIAGIAAKFAQKLRDSSRFERLPKDLADSLVILENGVAITPRESNISGSLKVLCQVAHFLYGEKVILLIDEYDVPLAQAEKKGYYLEMIDIIRNLFSAVLKDNIYLKRAILTGCLRISKESIFTGLNNLNVYDIYNADFSDLFGFTSSEVKQLLEDTGFSSMENTIREWYDGYRFGTGYWQEIFCPWDVINYIKDLSGKNASTVKEKPPFYWENCSSNNIFDRIKEKGGYLEASYVEDLLAGKCIAVELDQQVTYKNLYSFKRNWEQGEHKKRWNTLWTVLYMTGYLTLASPEKIQQCGIQPKGRESLLVIPNLEIRKLFEDIVVSLKDYAKANTRQALFDALLEGKAEAAQVLLSDILLHEVSVRKKANESYYQGLLQGIFIGGGYKTLVERESGNGYYDLAVIRGDKGIIIETKWAAKGGKRKLQSLVEEGVSQSKICDYGVDFTNLSQIFRYTIGLIGKQCLLKKVEEVYNVSSHKKEFIQA